MEFRPVPKPVSKPKEKPRYKERKPKKRKKLETFKGRTIPPAKVRGSISKKEYEKVIDIYGRSCAYCFSSYIEMHHIRFRSQQGRGTYRNLIPLCKEHHGLAHRNRVFADQLRRERIQAYGEWYWADKFDLWKQNLIPNTTDKAFEDFMLKEEVKARETVRTNQD